MSDYELPSCFAERNRVARKEHRCCECNSKISVGETYRYSSGVWDSQPSSYKTCLSCRELWDCLAEKNGEPLAFGDLKESISNCFCSSYNLFDFIDDNKQFESNILKLFGYKKVV